MCCICKNCSLHHIQALYWYDISFCSAKISFLFIMIFSELMAIKATSLGILVTAICFHRQNREDDRFESGNRSRKSLSINIRLYHAFPTVGNLVKYQISYFLLPSIMKYHEKQNRDFCTTQKRNITKYSFYWVGICWFWLRYLSWMWWFLEIGICGYCMIYYVLIALYLCEMAHEPTRDGRSLRESHPRGSAPLAKYKAINT